VTYAEAIQRLQSFQLFGFKPGLETTRRLAAAAGDPQNRLRFIHVAGTNGKGSTCAMLESVYRRAGLRTGLYTSPHLVRFGERIQMNREPIPDDDLARLTAELCAEASSLGPDFEPTFFEFATVLALKWFAASGCDIVLWETGLGGRLDATNIVEPLASVITNVGWDHQAVLGRTIAAIASEKAGIIKAGVPSLTAAAEPDALAILKARARECDSPLILVDEAAVERMDWPLGLAGPHQRVNAALAAATVRLLRFAIPVDDATLMGALAETRWAGRLQEVIRDGRILVLDGAHNAPGVEALVAAVERLYPGRRPVLVVGMLADKDWRPMLKRLLAVASRVITVPVASPRAVSAEELRAACVASGMGRPARAAASLDQALQWVSAEPFALVTGSLYLVGEALERLLLERGADGAERGLNAWNPPQSGSIRG
jgi:dihydrofolate synthase / folylpolyglutamate synthase